MASWISRMLANIKPTTRLAHNVLEKGTRVSGKARVKARKAKNKIGG